jgi:ribonuclease P protein component
VGATVLPKREQLRRPAEFRAVFQGGRRIECPAVLLVWKQGEGTRKAGFTVSRQIRGAVSRNRARRRVREAYRASGHLLPPRVQAVFVARRSAVNTPFDDLCRDVRSGLEVIAKGCVATQDR